MVTNTGIQEVFYIANIVKIILLSQSLTKLSLYIFQKLAFPYMTYIPPNSALIEIIKVSHRKRTF